MGRPPSALFGTTELTDTEKRHQKNRLMYLISFHDRGNFDFPAHPVEESIAAAEEDTVTVIACQAPGMWSILVLA